MNVEIWSDIVCPWCYIGKRRFETALAAFAHRDDVSLTWRSFELDPRAPRRSEDSLDEHLARKYGLAPAQAAAMNAHVTSLASAEGLSYHLERAKHGNTFDAHRLLHMADRSGLQAAAKERLLRAYFTDGLAIAETEVLVALAVEIGMNGDEVRAALDGETCADEVRADESRAAAFGISGVPFAVIDEKYGVSGAQSPDVFLQALERAWNESGAHSKANEKEQSGSCDGDSCAFPA